MSNSVSPRPPLVLGRYEVGVRIAGGGMANIYLGRAIGDDGGEELVALKVMRDEFERDPKFLRMFSDEAKILKRLSHPNVIKTLESGMTREHRYIVMEFLAGRTLADVWDLLVATGQRLDVRLAAWICARVAEGLHAAHELTDERGVEMNVVHRDVNPSNILLTYGGEVKLIDFGLAKARIRRSSTMLGIVKGKLPYLSPEQVGQRATDRRVDLYALGTTLWEACTMVRLFKRDTELDTLRAIRDGKVDDPRERVGDLPDALAEITLRALRYDPDERYATADALAKDLDAFIGDAAAEMKAALVAVVSRLFPGEEKKHVQWRNGAVATRVLATVPPPPILVTPGSSGSPGSAPEITIDDADIEIITSE